MKLILAFVLLIILTSLGIEKPKSVNLLKSTSVDSLLNKKVPHFNGYLLNDSVVDETFFHNKVALINFMFIGCTGCMQELPNLSRIYEKYANQNFILITIMPHIVADIKSYNGIGDTSKLYYTIRKNWGYASIKNTIIAECKIREVGDEHSLRPNCANISDRFLLNGYPKSFLVDKTGIIRKIYGNFHNNNEFEDLQLQIDSLLK
jgi:thiol-disulfide isomerase/thioredoxin